MINKKAITLQFHWIFILIAGGIILAFFFSIASKQGDLSDEKLSLSLVHSIDMILELAESSEGTSQVIPLPKKGISASCSSGCDCYFSISGARSSFGHCRLQVLCHETDLGYCCYTSHKNLDTG